MTRRILGLSDFLLPDGTLRSVTPQTKTCLRDPDMCRHFVTLRCSVTEIPSPHFSRVGFLFFEEFMTFYIRHRQVEDLATVAATSITFARGRSGVLNFVYDRER
jgi:hypothetical protein